MKLERQQEVLKCFETLNLSHMPGQPQSLPPAESRSQHLRCQEGTDGVPSQAHSHGLH